MDFDTGGWCAPREIMCICGQVFDETHDQELCHRLLPIMDEPPMLLSDYIAQRNQEYP
jgi:hypothetical protein